jgi:hypothetical protein
MEDLSQRENATDHHQENERKTNKPEQCIKAENNMK